MYKQVLKNKDFLKVYLATCISSFGDGLDDIAFALLVYKISNSTFISSYVFAIKIICSFFTIFTGALADRVRKKTLILFAELAQAGILIILIILSRTSIINTSLLIIIATLQAIFSTISMPAKSTLSFLVIDKDSLIESKSLLNMSLQLIQIFSYALSAIFIEVLGMYLMLFIDSLTFIVSAILFMIVGYKEINVPYRKLSEFKDDIVEGIRFIKDKKSIILILFLALFGNVLMAPCDSLMPAYFNNYYNNGGEYSLYMCTLAIGGILSAFFLPKVCKCLSEFNILIIGFILGGVGSTMLFIIGSNIYFSIAAIFVGCSFSLVSILNANILQRLTPNNMLGRVFSIFKSISYIASPAGMILVGGMGELIEIRYIFLFSGILMISLIAIGLMNKKGRIKYIDES